MADVSESFNFYDLYGYLFPGVALTLLLVLPFWCYGRGPKADFGLGSALGATIAAYIFGHFLQTIAVSAMPSKVGGRHPSDFVLDDDDKSFTPDLKAKIRMAVLDAFGINVLEAGNRRDVFFLCRDVLVTSKQASYVEQFEGMYSMMRGLSAALLLGAGYWGGWALAFLPICSFVVPATLVLGIGIALISAVMAHSKGTQETPAGKAILAGLILAVAAIGCFLGTKMMVTGQQAIGFVVASFLALLLCIRCYGAYKSFAIQYATAVWRGFLALRLVPPKGARSD